MACASVGPSAGLSPSSNVSGSCSNPFSRRAFLFALVSETHRPSSGCFEGGLACPFSALNSSSFRKSVSKEKYRHSANCLLASGPSSFDRDVDDDADFLGAFSTTIRRNSASSVRSKNGTAADVTSALSGNGERCGSRRPSTTSMPAASIAPSSKAPVASFVPPPLAGVVLSRSSLPLRSFSDWMFLKVPSNLATRLANDGTLTPAALTARRPG
mmetsp:Transcript_29582/g.54164  ORF Transcript_29582/g.54164 Transcript_29582/m.54164 type:complete len:214 (-) Transcript_29582:647-1288(-)